MRTPLGSSHRWHPSVILAVILTWSIVIIGPLAKASSPHHQREMSVNIGIELDFPPYVSVDSWGRPEGYAVDLIKAVSRHSNIELNVAIGSWSQIRKKLESAEIDAIPLMAKTAERAKKVDFTDTHMVAYDAIFIHADETAIKGQSDLPGKRIVVMKGDLAEDYLSHNDMGVEIVRVESSIEAFKILAIKQADAFIVSQMAGLMVINTNNLSSVKLAEEPHFGNYRREYAFAVRKGQLELLTRLNEGLKAVVATGEYAKIYETWFSQLDPEAHRRSLRQRQLLFGLLIAIAAAVVSAAFVLFLKAEVNRKTRSLERSEERYRGLVENLPGAVFRASKLEGAWQLDYLSDTIESLSGYPASTFMGSDAVDFFSIIHPDDRVAAFELATQVMRDCSRCDMDFRIIRRDGESRWLHVRGSCSVDREGHSFFDGILLDVSEQKTVADLLTLQQSKMASSARLSALGEMAGGIAHEINNPLAIINLRTHQLAQKAAKGPVDPAYALMIAQGIESTSIRISKIIKSLQTVARESEHDPFEVAPVSAIINDAFELCHQRMKKYGVNVTIDPIPEDLTIECRRVQISQVLINLLNNAFDAIVGLPKRYILISAREIFEHGVASVEIAIVDSGTGIPVDHAQKIFQPFYTTKGPGKGTGLGLSISKGMVEAHEGHIYLDTKHPTTRFVIVLPKEQDSQTKTSIRPMQAMQVVREPESPTLN